MVGRESPTLEYKEAISKTFLKTVSAYANFNTGKIVFGIDDKGSTVGINDPVNECLRIENMINDSIDPSPRFTLEPNTKSKTVTLTVFQGIHKPYLFKGKAYKRNDSSTVEVDRLEYGRLVLEGSNITYDAIEAGEQTLIFSLLENKLEDVLGVTSLTTDVMRSLELVSKDGKYTNAAALLADKNQFPGIDMMRFGESLNEIMNRDSFTNISVIDQLENAIDLFEKYYSYERIEGESRTPYSLIPPEAFREAIANAIIHRTWDVQANITISMFSDRIEITSPGGLPSGISEDEYLRGMISIPRNPILANVFFRLRYIEKFGTGIQRILESYVDKKNAPSFCIQDNSISITLPTEKATPLTTDEETVLSIISKEVLLSRSEISSSLGLSKDKTVRILNSLINKGALTKQGEGRATRYTKS